MRPLVRESSGGVQYRERLLVHPARQAASTRSRDQRYGGVTNRKRSAGTKRSFPCSFDMEATPATEGSDGLRLRQAPYPSIENRGSASAGI